MAFHVVSVVPDAQRLMAEAQRVCRPGGRHHDHQPLPQRAPGRGARAARQIDPLTRRLGWTTSLRLPDLLDRDTLHVERQWKTSPRSLFTIVIARNAKAVPAGRRRRAATRRRSVTCAGIRRGRDDAAPDQLVGLARPARV